jgi:nucleotide-binding universal stress UspA family protein
MVDRFLFPTDGSEAVRAGFDYALALADRMDAELFVLHVADTSEISHTRVGGEVVDAFVQEGESIVEETVAEAGRDVEVTTDVIQGVPDKTIVAYAEEYDIDCILMPTRDRGGVERLLGSTTERVLRQASVPVIAMPPEAVDADRIPYEAVLVAVDGSDASEAAVEAGAEMAAHHGAALHLVHVLEESLFGGLSADSEDLESEAASIVGAATSAVPSSFSGEVTTNVQRASTAEAGILEYAEDHDIDLVVSGTSGRSKLGQYLLGSTTEKLIRNASIPVMAVRSES